MQKPSINDKFLSINCDVLLAPLLAVCYIIGIQSVLYEPEAILGKVKIYAI